MKTNHWILLISVLLMLSLGFSFPLLLPGNAADFAEIISNGQTVKTVSLHRNQEFTISSPNGGENTVTILDGKIGVTAASCPDHYCIDRGMCNSGTQIVCLPNRLIIRFRGSLEVDSVSG